MALHTKVNVIRSTGSREEEFKGLGMYGHGGHLGYITNIISNIFFSSYLKAYMHIFVKKVQWFVRPKDQWSCKRSSDI